MAVRPVEMTMRPFRVRSTVGVVVRSAAARVIAARMNAARTAPAAARTAATAASLWRGGN
jgi:hypothetical protein